MSARACDKESRDQTCKQLAVIIIIMYLFVKIYGTILSVSLPSSCADVYGYRLAVLCRN